MTVETLKKWIGEYVAVHVASQPFAGAPSRRIHGIHNRVAGPIIRLEMDAVARQSGDHPRQRTAAINRARDKIMNGTMASMLYDYQTML